MNRILVVDQDKILGNLLRVNLEVRGYQVAMAQDESDSLRIARGERPDLILLGPGMPGSLHKKVVAAFKEDAELQKVPLVIVMDYRYDDDDYDLYNSGIPGVHLKPFDMGELMQTVRSALGNGSGAL